MSSYEQKLEFARLIIEEHNSNVDKPDKVGFDTFLKNLKKAGGTTEAALNLCTWEDIEACGGRGISYMEEVPRLLARQISKIFRKQTDKRPKAITHKKALVMNMRELLEAYDPKETGGAVTLRLKTLSKNGPCIVLNEDNSVNIEASVECLNDIREDFGPRKIYILNGIPQKVHYLGISPNTVADENPLILNSVLRGVDQVCEKTYRSWEDVPHKARVLCRLALETGELKITQVGDIHSTLDLLFDKKDDEAVKVIAQRFPQASLNYKELEVQGNLPTLKLIRGKISIKKQDPFYQKHKTY